MGKFQFVIINSTNSTKKNLDVKIIELIKRRRRQILVHSAIYYRFGTSLIEDFTFDKWARELRDLQNKFPNESKESEFYEEFKDWDATTGYNLPVYPFLDKADQLIKYSEKLREENAEIGD